MTASAPADANHIGLRTSLRCWRAVGSGRGVARGPGLDGRRSCRRKAGRIVVTRLSQVRHRRRAEYDRGHLGSQRDARVDELAADGRAVGALVHVLGHPGLVGGRQRVLQIAAELLGYRPAVRPGERGDVRAQDGLAEAFARPPVKEGDAVRRPAEYRGQLGCGFPLDLGVPEDRAPSLRKREESGHDPRLVRTRHSRRQERLAGLGQLPARRRAPQRGQDIGPEGVGRASAAPCHLVDQAECLGDEMIGLRRGPYQLARQPPDGLHVPLIKDTERRRVAGPHQVQQLRIVGCACTRCPVRHFSPRPRVTPDYARESSLLPWRDGTESP